MLNIICPYRGRENMFLDFIQHYRNFYPDSNIYMVEQNDDDPFKRGQLVNVIFKDLLNKNNIDNIVVIDIDLRLFYKIDFEMLIEKYHSVIVPFDNILLYNIKDIGEYEKSTRTPYFQTGDKVMGGITTFNKNVFINCNGFSNLYIGWGCEDSDFINRNKIVNREKNDIFHLEHPRIVFNIKRNAMIYNNIKSDYHQDGFLQTTSSEILIKEIESQVFHYKIKNISVIPNFFYNKYIDIYINKKPKKGIYIKNNRIYKRQ